MGTLTKYKQAAAATKPEAPAPLAGTFTNRLGSWAGSQSMQGRPPQFPPRPPSTAVRVMQLSREVVYTPGICSAKGIPVLYVCERDEDGGWVSRDVILASDKARHPGTIATPGVASIVLRFREALICPCCRIRVNSLLTGKRRLPGGGWCCEGCLTPNCFGSHVVRAGVLWVRCGRCGQEGVIDGSPYNGAFDSTRGTIFGSPPTSSGNAAPRGISGGNDVKRLR